VDGTFLAQRKVREKGWPGGSSPRSVQDIHTTLRKALQDAMSDGLIPRRPAAIFTDLPRETVW
jgi:hypothetical protein